MAAGCALAVVVVFAVVEPAAPPIQRPATLTEPEPPAAPRPQNRDDQTPPEGAAGAAETPTEDESASRDDSGAVPASPPPEPATSCPCEVIDWRCRQDNEAVCPAWTPPPSTPADEEERPPVVEDAEPTAPAEPVDASAPANFQRRGITIAPAVGLGACGHNWCDGYRVGFWGQLELGFRFGVFAPVVGVGGGAGPFKGQVLQEDIMWPNAIDDGRVTFFGAGAGLFVFPVRSGRLDPFFGVRLGYSRVQLTATDAIGVSFLETVKRGAVRFGGGLSIFVSDRVQLGPRFDVSVPFAGDVCAEVAFMGDSEGSCWPVRRLEDVRVDSSGLPVPYSFVFELRAILGSFET